MNQTVLDFFEREKEKDVRLEILPNGIRYRSTKCLKFNILHECYIPLTDEQIDILQAGVNQERYADFIFPEWYRDFLKTTNGCNLFFGRLSLFGEQTPLVYSESTKTYEKALIDRSNPDWMAPYNLRQGGSVKFDKCARDRWLGFGCYGFDGTQIAWDYQTQSIVAMYSLPVTTSVKALKKLKEEDYERMICARWDSFDEFFMRETERFREVISKYGVDQEKGFLHGEKTLPIGHRDYQD